jgi:hypothetical protein
LLVALTHLFTVLTLTNSLLYTFGSCGEEYAPEGFYVDTFGDIFSWEETDTGWTWSFLGNCEPTPSCDDKSLSIWGISW